MVRVVCRVRKSQPGGARPGCAASRASTPPRPGRRRGRRPRSPSRRPARAATSRPIRPKADDPQPLPCGSTPAKDLRSHFSDFIEASAAGMFRARESRSGQRQLAVETRLPPGEFMTMTPRRVAAARSTLSTPTPGRPITLRLFAASRHLGRDLAAAADGDRVVGADDPGESAGRERLLDVDRPPFGPQDLEAAVGDSFEDENAVADDAPLAEVNAVDRPACGRLSLFAPRRHSPAGSSRRSIPSRASRCSSSVPHNLWKNLWKHREVVAPTLVESVC